ncbi:hypothetical protein ACWDUL_38440 [Nocardia niigatensis]
MTLSIITIRTLGRVRGLQRWSTARLAAEMEALTPTERGLRACEDDRRRCGYSIDVLCERHPVIDHAYAQAWFDGFGPGGPEAFIVAAARAVAGVTAPSSTTAQGRKPHVRHA